MASFKCNRNMIKKKIKTTSNHQPVFLFKITSSSVETSALWVGSHISPPLYFVVGRRYKTTQSQQTNFQDCCRCLCLIFPLQTGERRGCVHFRPIRAQTLLWFFLLPAWNDQTPGRPTSPSLAVEDQENFPQGAAGSKKTKETIMNKGKSTTTKIQNKSW